MPQTRSETLITNLTPLHLHDATDPSPFLMGNSHSFLRENCEADPQPCLYTSCNECQLFCLYELGFLLGAQGAPRVCSFQSCDVAKTRNHLENNLAKIGSRPDLKANFFSEILFIFWLPCILEPVLLTWGINQIYFSPEIWRIRAIIFTVYLEAANSTSGNLGKYSQKTNCVCGEGGGWG